MRPSRAAFVCLIALASPCAWAEEAERGEARRTVFETWGDEWFLKEGKDDVPPIYSHLLSKRCEDCNGKDRVVVFERFLPLSMSIAIDRTELHVADNSSLDLLQAVQSSREGSWENSFRLTFADKRVWSDITANAGRSPDPWNKFIEEHAWRKTFDARVSHPRTMFKTVELMALQKTEKLSFAVLSGKETKTLSLAFVEEADLDHDGKTFKTRCYEARYKDPDEVTRLWVNNDLGLLQFAEGTEVPIRRVAEAKARLALGLLADKAEEKRRERMGDESDPKPERTPANIRVVLDCDASGADLPAFVDGVEMTDTVALEARLVKKVEGHVKAGEEYVVFIDAGAEVPWRRVIEIMDLCKKHKITKVELAAPMPPRK